MLIIVPFLLIQVVVFEVIQLPSTNNAHSNEQTVTMLDGNTLMLNDGDTQEYSIIEPAGDYVNNFFGYEDSVSDTEDMENISSVSSGMKILFNLIIILKK